MSFCEIAFIRHPLIARWRLETSTWLGPSTCFTLVTCNNILHCTLMNSRTCLTPASQSESNIFHLPMCINTVLLKIHLTVQLTDLLTWCSGLFMCNKSILKKKSSPGLRHNKITNIWTLQTELYLKHIQSSVNYRSRNSFHCLWETDSIYKPRGMLILLNTNSLSDTRESINASNIMEREPSRIWEDFQWSARVLMHELRKLQGTCLDRVLTRSQWFSGVWNAAGIKWEHFQPGVLICPHSLTT